MSYSGPPSLVKEPQPSGRLQVYEPKDFPFLHTGKSLVFTIARNGHVWGKRLDHESAKGDVELQVFYPSEDGCLIRMLVVAPDLRLDRQLTLREAKQKYADWLSKEQERKIESILSQKEIIQYELGTLMVRPFVTSDPNYKDWRHQTQYQRMTEKCKLDFPMGEPCNIKVVDCSYDNKSSAISRLGVWSLCYDNNNFRFSFSSQKELNSRKDKAQCAAGLQAKIEDVNKWVYGRLDEAYATRFYVVQAENKQFNVSDFGSSKNKKRFKPTLNIMYGEHSFFDYFAVDDAVLLLEESFGEKGRSELHWTLGIAQNGLERERIRLASNNPDLFKPLFNDKMSSLRKEFMKHDHVYPGGEVRIED